MTVSCSAPVRFVLVAMVLALGGVDRTRLSAQTTSPDLPPLFVFAPQTIGAGQTVTLTGTRFGTATAAAILLIDVSGQATTIGTVSPAAGGFSADFTVTRPGTFFVVVKDSLGRVAINLMGPLSVIPSGRPWFTFDPPTAAPGGTIDVSAHGFSPNSTTGVAVLGGSAGGGVTLLGAAAFSEGELSADFAVPAAQPPGSYQVLLKDLAGPFGLNATGPLAVSAIPDPPRIDVGFYPIGAVANWLTDRVYVPNGGDNTVSIIDGATGTRVSDVEVGSLPCAIGLDQWSNRVYVANVNTNDVSVIDTLTGRVVAQVAVGHHPCAVGVLPKLKRIVVGNYASDTVSILDGTTNAVVATVPVGRGPFGIGANAATNRVYVANGYDGSISVLDGATNAVIATVPVGKDPDAVAVNPFTNRVYVANYLSGTVTVINGATHAIVATVIVGREPSGIAVNPSTNHVLVTNYASNTVSVIDGATNAVIATVPVGDTPDGVAVNPVTNQVFVVNSNTHDVSVFEDAY